MVFCFIQNFFFRQHKSQNIHFFCSAKQEFFFPEFNIRLYDKNSESEYFFFFHQNKNIFFSNIRNQNIFLEKKPIPFQVKWSVPDDYYDQNQIKDIAKGGLVTEITFNLDSPATSNNQYFILVRFYYSSNEYFDIKSSFVCSFCPSIFD